MNRFGKLLLPLFAVISAAQEIRFESGVTNIHIDAIVTQNAQDLHGLGREDFVVRDGGVTEPLIAFQEETVPLDLVLLVDTSLFPLGTQNPKNIVNGMFTAASGALRQLRKEDRIAIISLAGPHLEQDLTTDQDAISMGLQRSRTRGKGEGTRALAIQWAVWLFKADAKRRASGTPERKRAILLVTRDQSLVWAPDEVVIQQLWSMDIALHAIIIHADQSRSRIIGPRLDNPDHIARATGGAIGRDPERDFPSLVTHIRSSYSLWYRAPAAKQGELRQITVELSEQAKKKFPGAQIRAREGYVAP